MKIGVAGYFFGKHIKLRNQARLCLVIYDFEAHIPRVTQKKRAPCTL